MVRSHIHIEQRVYENTNLLWIFELYLFKWKHSFFLHSIHRLACEIKRITMNVEGLLFPLLDEGFESLRLHLKKLTKTVGFFVLNPARTR